MTPSPTARRTRARTALGLLLVVVAAVAMAGPGAAALDPAVATAADGEGAPVTVTRNIDYGGPGQRGHVLDAYVPEGGGTDRPAVVLVHGGGWVGGTRNDVAPDAEAMARQGIVAFAIAYVVEGTSRFPDEVEDTAQAVRWVQDHAADYRIDPARVGLFGSSAGGNLAMLVATGGVGDGHPPVRAVVSWSGPTDLTVLAIPGVPGEELAAPSTVPIPGAPVPVGCEGDPACLGVLGPNYIQGYLGCTIDECPERYVAASPALQVRVDTPPVYLAGARVDLVPIDQAYAMVNALTAHGVASRLQVVAGEGHAESLRDQALEPSIEFLRRQLAPGAGDAERHVAPGSPPTTVGGSEPLPPLGAGNQLPTPAAVLATDAGRGPWVRIAAGAGAVLALGVVAGLVVLGVRRRQAIASG